MGGISHLRHGLRLDRYEEAEVHAFCRLLLVLLIKDGQASLGFVLVLPYGSLVSLDSEEVRLVSPFLWLILLLQGPLFRLSPSERPAKFVHRCGAIWGLTRGNKVWYAEVMNDMGHKWIVEGDPLEGGEVLCRLCGCRAGGRYAVQLCEAVIHRTENFSTDSD